LDENFNTRRQKNQINSQNLHKIENYSCFLKLFKVCEENVILKMSLDSGNEILYN